jgi:hypothetical protein
MFQLLLPYPTRPTRLPPSVPLLGCLITFGGFRRGAGLACTKQTPTTSAFPSTTGNATAPCFSVVSEANEAGNLNVRRRRPPRRRTTTTLRTPRGSLTCATSEADASPESRSDTASTPSPSRSRATPFFFSTAPRPSPTRSPQARRPRLQLSHNSRKKTARFVQPLAPNVQRLATRREHERHSTMFRATSTKPGQLQSGIRAVFTGGRRRRPEAATALFGDVQTRSAHVSHGLPSGAIGAPRRPPR